MTSHDTAPLSQASEPSRLPKKKLPALIDVALPAVAIGSGAMLFLAVPNIVEGNDLWSYAKAFTLAVSATVISFAVNRLAIERGAPLATRGYWSAAFVSVASILAVGAGLFAATYSGLVFKDTAELLLEKHGTDLSEAVAKRSAAAAQAARVNPVIGSIIDDLSQKTVCEREESCISGRATGGRGPVTLVMEELTGRAGAVAAQVRNGEATRQEVVDDLGAMIAGYQAALGDSAKDVWSRRAELQTIDARIREALGELSEAVPVALLSAYADELKGGTTIPGQPQAEAKLDHLLQRYGESLSAVIATIEIEVREVPVFPKRTGVSDTFGYLAHFLPVAAIAAVVELLFPLVLWTYTCAALGWEARRQENAEQPRDHRSADRIHPDGASASDIARPQPAEDRWLNNRPSHRRRPNGRDRDWPRQ
jgi:hypothetical protein